MHCQPTLDQEDSRYLAIPRITPRQGNNLPQNERNLRNSGTDCRSQVKAPNVKSGFFRTVDTLRIDHRPRQ